MKRFAWLALAAVLGATMPGRAFALTIKLGTLAPAGSPWELALKRMAAEWAKLSNGSVSVKIYPGGIAGDEMDVLRKMRIGQLNAAGITVSGLQGIYNGVKILSYPRFLQSPGEFAYVLERMKPFFERELEKRGYKVLMWWPAGWVYFFSRYPIVTIGDLMRQKLWVWNGDPDEMQAWQSSGVPTVPLASTDLMTSLQGGMVDVVMTSPLVAASNQWFGIMSNMCSLKLSPLWGAVIVSSKSWAEVPADMQRTLADAAKKISDSLEPGVAKADEEAIAVMKKYGLRVNQTTKADEAEWASLMAKGLTMMVGKGYDRESYEIARQLIDEYRAANPGQ
jgi:TRAP-type C4-dicarboxylate transport system substrate-binding protein